MPFVCLVFFFKPRNAWLSQEEVSQISWTGSWGMIGFPEKLCMREAVFMAESLNMMELCLQRRWTIKFAPPGTSGRVCSFRVFAELHGRLRSCGTNLHLWKAWSNMQKFPFLTWIVCYFWDYTCIFFFSFILANPSYTLPCSVSHLWPVFSFIAVTCIYVNAYSCTVQNVNQSFFIPSMYAFQNHCLIWDLQQVCSSLSRRISLSLTKFYGKRKRKS